MLKFDKKPKRDTPLTVRLPAEVINKLKKIAAHHEVSQADIVEKLIEMAYTDLTRKR